MTLTKGQQKFNDIIEQVEQFKNSKRDYYENLHNIRTSYEGEIVINNGSYVLTPYAKVQLGQSLHVPMPSTYTNAIDNHLFMKNFEHLKIDSKNDRKLIRTHKDFSYGVLTDSYTPIDNFQVLSCLGEAINNSAFRADFDIFSRKTNFSHYSSAEKINLKLVLKDLRDVGVTITGTRDLHQLGVIVSNSEVGKGAVMLKAYICRVVCQNGLVIGSKGETLFRQVHLTSVPNFMLRQKLEHGIKNALNIAEQTIEKLKEAKKVEITDVHAIIEKIAKQYDFNKKFTESVKVAYELEPVKSKFYIIQAITHASKELQEDEQIKMETIASKILLAS
jgi:hypothetical protein